MLNISSAPQTSFRHIKRLNALRWWREVSIDGRHGQRHVVGGVAVERRHGRHAVAVVVRRRRRREARPRRPRHESGADVTQLVTLDVAVLFDGVA